jgi:hypothetical protein
MKLAKELSTRSVSFAIAIVLLLPISAAGQAGYNAICESSTSCSATSNLIGSAAFIDASMFVGNVTSPTFCSVLNWILNTNNHVFPATGGTIDARGLPGTTPVSMSCTTSPWGGLSSPPPSVILLPANIINTSASWVLPSNTKLIGTAKGNGNLGTNYILETTIKATANNTAVVQFGNSNFCPSGCQGISVEHLTIHGNGGSSITTNGIENDYCGLQCYVDHVTLYQVLGVGLKISAASASDSGPYLNITFDMGGIAPTSSTTCAHIINTTGTKGIHGITCLAGSNANNGILVDAPSNSIEDVRIIGFNNGIAVGVNAAASGNVVVNVWGDTAGTISQSTNLIEISNNYTKTSDLVITGLANASTQYAYTIYDELTQTTLADPYIAMYALGEANSGGYSRFTTSTSTASNNATWFFGTQTTPSTACNLGSLYSNTGSGQLWVCAPSGWASVTH